MPPSEREKCWPTNPIVPRTRNWFRLGSGATADRALQRRFAARPRATPRHPPGIARRWARVWIEPFQCDYGANIHSGRAFISISTARFWTAPVEGANCKFGPGVQIYTAYHPLDPRERASGLEWLRRFGSGNA